MKIFNSLIVIFFCVSPILSYYIHDDTAKSGYVSVQNSGRHYERRGIRGMQRRHFAGSTHRHKNENIVDSHFKVRKTPPYLPYQPPRGGPLKNSRVEVPARRWNTVAPPIQQTKRKDVLEERRQQEPIAHGHQISAEKSQSNQLSNVHRSRPAHTDILGQVPARRNMQRRYQDYQNRFDPKPSLLEMNVHKTQVSTDPQPIRLNNNHQITSISLQRPEEKYQKIPTSAVVDKSLQQAKAHNNDHNTQVMSRVLDDMSHDVTDMKFKGEYRKRDTEYNDRSYDYNKDNRNLISDTIRKYIVGKPINFGRKNTKEIARIGSREESIEPEESPYAIFYRMHPDNLDEQDGFVSMSSMEENINMFSNKKKRLSNYDTQVDLKNIQKRSKKNSDLDRVHKKVKHFSNYRTL